MEVGVILYHMIVMPNGKEVGIYMAEMKGHTKEMAIPLIDLG